jgi:hypothetical protein
MQPYFYPYAGYFRLFAVADIVVLLDDVQFPRRGRVHRSEVPGPSGRIEWLTLPLTRQPRAVVIKDLSFSPDSAGEWRRRLSRLKSLSQGSGPLADRVRENLYGPLDNVVDFVERGLRLVVRELGLPSQIARSSDFKLGGGRLCGEARVIALVQAAGGQCYVNPPGGRRLYEPATFSAHGIKLRFLPPYDGEFRYLLPSLMTTEPDRLRLDVLRSATLVE